MAQMRPTSSANSGQHHVTANDEGRRPRNLGPIPAEALKEVQNVLGIESSEALHETEILTRLAVEHIIDLHLTRAQILITSEPKRLKMAQKIIKDALKIAHAVSDIYLQAKCLFWQAVAHGQEGNHGDAALGFSYAFVNFAPFLPKQGSLEIDELPTSKELCIEMCLLLRYLDKYRDYINHFLATGEAQDRGQIGEILAFIDQSIQTNSDKSMNQINNIPDHQIDDKPRNRTLNRIRDRVRTRPLSEMSDQFERLMNEVCRPVVARPDTPQSGASIDIPEVSSEPVSDASNPEFQRMDDIMPMLQAGTPRARAPKESKSGLDDKKSDKVNETFGRRLRPTSVSTEGSSSLRARGNSLPAIEQQMSSPFASQDDRESVQTSFSNPDSFWLGRSKSSPLSQEVAKEVELSDALTPEELGTRSNSLSRRRVSLPLSISIGIDSTSLDSDMERNLTHPRDSTKPSISSPLRTMFSASEHVPGDASTSDTSAEQSLAKNMRGDGGFGNLGV